MKEIIMTIVSILVAGIVVLLCFSSCYLAGKSDAYWEDVKKKMEKDKNERH